jgi:hypothetical protein
MDNSRMVRVRVKETGQVLDMVPDVARAMILGGTAEEVKPVTEKKVSLDTRPESMAVATVTEHAVDHAQAKPATKSAASASRRK